MSSTRLPSVLVAAALPPGRIFDTPPLGRALQSAASALGLAPYTRLGKDGPLTRARLDWWS